MVIAITVIIVAPAFVLPALRRPVAIGAALFVLLFGWGVPWLARLG